MTLFMSIFSLSLRQIRPDLLKKTEVALQESFWYQGGEKYFDLFLDFSDGALIRLFLSFRGQFLEWHLDQSLKTGTTNEMQSDHGPSPKSKLIHVQLNFWWPPGWMQRWRLSVNPCAQGFFESLWDPRWPQ